MAAPEVLSMEGAQGLRDGGLSYLDQGPLSFGWASLVRQLWAGLVGGTRAPPPLSVACFRDTHCLPCSL